MKKIFLFFILFFSYHYTFADTRIGSITNPRGIIQNSPTNFTWYGVNFFSRGGNNIWTFDLYDKFGNNLNIGMTGINNRTTLGEDKIALNTIDLGNYIIFIITTNNSFYFDYSIFKKNDMSLLKSGNMQYAFSFALVNNKFIFTTGGTYPANDVYTFDLTNGLISTGSTYSNIPGLLSIVLNTAPNYDKYLLNQNIQIQGGGLVYKDYGVDLYQNTTYLIKYKEWDFNNSETIASIGNFGVLVTNSQPFIRYNNIGPYSIDGKIVSYFTYSTNGPNNFFNINGQDQYFNLMTFKKIKGENNDTRTPYNGNYDLSRLYILFARYSKVYYINDPRLLNFTFNIGPMTGYVLDNVGNISNIIYASGNILYSKTDLTGFSGSTEYAGLPTTGTTSDTYDSSIWDWDTNMDGDISISEFFAGLGKVIKYFFEKLLDFFQNIKSLIIQLGGIFTTEVKTFSFEFVPSTYANNDISSIINNNVDQERYNRSFLGKMDLFFKGFLSFFILVIGVAFFIFVNRYRKNG